MGNPRFICIYNENIIRIIIIWIKLNYNFVGIRNLLMDVSEFCHICKKPSDQILMLACVHDVCIECAATNYAEQTQIKGLNPNVS